MSSTHKSNTTVRAVNLPLSELAWPDGMELRRHLHDIQRCRAPLSAPTLPMRIGIEDACGDLVQVIEVTGLSEAVKVFETLADHGLVRGHGRCRTSDGRALVRTYRPPVGRAAAPLPADQAAAQHGAIAGRAE